MSILRMGKVILLVAMCTFFAAAVYVSSLINERQNALKEVSRYNICWLASQAVAEFTRLEATIAAVGIKGAKVDADDAQLRLDIVNNRLGLISDGEFKEFASRDPETAGVATQLAAVLEKVQPLVDHIDQPGAISKALALLSPLDSKLAQLAASANRFGGDRVVQDQHELIKLHWIFSSVVGGLFFCGISLLAFLGWHNKLLARAHLSLHQLTQKLQMASSGLELANSEVRTINAELQARNEILLCRDRELGTQNKRFDAALNNMSHALCMVDVQERLVVYNHRFAKLFDLEFTPIPGILFQDLIDLSANVYLDEVYRIQKTVSGGVESGACVKDLSDGRTISVSCEPMPDGGWVATYEDISQRRQAEAQITYLAHHDALTGLVNRVFFNEQLEPALARADRQLGRLAVLCLDLDGFKDVNDSFGHPTGDALLREVGIRLKANSREGDVVARLGGDEFAILQMQVDGPDECGRLAARLVDCLSEPVDLDGRRVQISASIGIALAPADGRTGEDLMKNADLALYRAKDEGKATYRFFEAVMDAERKTRRSFENDLRVALDNGEIEVFYQPLVNARVVKLTGFEALLRWRHPVRGLVSPVKFIPVAEEIGIIASLGEWALRQACTQAASWPNGLSVAVNLSSVQLKSGELVQMVRDALRCAGLPARRLELEITESVLLHENDATLQTLHELRTLGIRIGMDDFGTGYSSLSYLRSFPFDKIKIDQSFVRELSSRPDCIKIVRSIAALGASLGMTTTAEGVETIDQFHQLQDAGCDQVQGYYFGRPVPADQLRFTLSPPEAPTIRAA